MLLYFCRSAETLNSLTFVLKSSEKVKSRSAIKVIVNLKCVLKTQPPSPPKTFIWLMLRVCPPILALVHLVCFACDHFFSRHFLCPPRVTRLSREAHGLGSKIGFHGALRARRRLFYLLKSTRATNLQLLSGAWVSSSWTPDFLINSPTASCWCACLRAHVCSPPCLCVHVRACATWQRWLFLKATVLSKSRLL